ncbi:hypothetical protein [Nonomuraea sp. KM90]|uniref:hypothetical protein n=1 Tax=Nonomuraea sp. KM90 TaxID=3457428 RepID=UPI003FCE49AA
MLEAADIVIDALPRHRLQAGAMDGQIADAATMVAHGRVLVIRRHGSSPLHF